MTMSKLIPKPPGATWTDDQWQAITLNGNDILVAAAAGSGKTAVLVERIIHKITDAEDPIDVDRLLVVTFTNAAAAEMRKRVGEALEKAIASDPSSLHLRRQLSLLNRASISTLHSFCLDVLHKYYYKLDLDPSFRIADTTEAQLLRDEVMEELFEEEYSSSDNELFLDLVDRYSSDRDDGTIQNMILKLYDFSRANPDPQAWLREIYNVYQLNGITTINDLPWIKELLNDIHLQLEGSKALFEKGLSITREPDGPAPYAENLDQDIQIAEDLLSASKNGWDALYQAYQNVSFKNLKRVKKDECDETLKKQAKDLRDKGKEQINKLQSELFTRTPDMYLQDLEKLAPVIDVLIRLVEEFSNRFMEVKKEKGIVDFSDLEHLTLEVLTNEGSEEASEAALEYKRYFEEVLVDEYQDTNLVQETILQNITQEGRMFMVGDVKQSIYRFRLAEPGLFLSKYRRFDKTSGEHGFRIDLSKNFRSRDEVLNGTNYIFKQIMNEKVGEIEYDEAAELVPGAPYPESPSTCAELLVIDRQDHSPEEQEEEQDQENESVVNTAELETAQLEGRLLAQQIKKLIAEPFQVFDKKTKTYRHLKYRDIVILQRSFSWAPVIMEELKKQGIPVYAELSSGYFEAIEVSIMMSLLKVVDNPRQDIPLASVLRSPIVGLDENDLAKIRIHQKKSAFYDVLLNFTEEAENEEKLINKLTYFIKQLDEWRNLARQGELSDLIWSIYRVTGYFDFVGGMPGGKQRQANLRALYDRARQYEATSFRGLFRFLRFVERMRERGEDLGTARALGEQEDVVRMMTIHKSKGLEFPIVFVSGLNKQFNMQDMRGSVLLHKDLGFGTKFIDPKLRVTYPTLPQLAMKRRMQLEMVAEEMRVLYVALTRAEEKLFLVGTAKDAQKSLQQWLSYVEHQEWILPDYDRLSVKSYLDWIGPAVIRHQGLKDFHEDGSRVLEDVFSHCSKWTLTILHQDELAQVEGEEIKEQLELEQAIRNWQPVDRTSQYRDKVEGQLSWNYPYAYALAKHSKQSVTELKRKQETDDSNRGQDIAPSVKTQFTKRPKFLQAKKMSAAEKGTAMHTVMQHLPLRENPSIEQIQDLVDKLVLKEILTEDQASVIDTDKIKLFLESDLGRRLSKAHAIHREVPFSMGIPADEAFGDWNEADQERVLVQGVMDCVMEESDGLVLIDYKTDQIHDRFTSFEEAKPILEKRYYVQVEMYTRALEQIWKKPVKAKYLYFFDGGHLISM